MSEPVKPCPCPLLVILSTSGINKSTLRKLEDAGYAVLVVESMDHVKLIEPVPSAQIGIITREALKAIADSSAYTTIKSDFGLGVARALLKDKEPNGQP